MGGFAKHEEPTSGMDLKNLHLKKICKCYHTGAGFCKELDTRLQGEDAW